jgi:hypothetical protein
MEKENTQKTHHTRDLGCAAFLHAKRYPLIKSERNGKHVIFHFENPENFVDIEDAMEKYYASATVKAFDFWQSIRSLKTIIYERAKQ